METNDTVWSNNFSCLCDAVVTAAPDPSASVAMFAGQWLRALKRVGRCRLVVLRKKIRVETIEQHEAVGRQINLDFFATGRTAIVETIEVA